MRVGADASPTSATILNTTRWGPLVTTGANAPFNETNTGWSFRAISKVSLLYALSSSDISKVALWSPVPFSVRYTVLSMANLIPVAGMPVSAPSIHQLPFGPICGMMGWM